MCTLVGIVYLEYTRSLGPKQDEASSRRRPTWRYMASQPTGAALRWNDRAPPSLGPTRVLGRHPVDVAHHLLGFLEAAEAAEFGRDRVALAILSASLALLGEVAVEKL